MRWKLTPALNCRAWPSSALSICTAWRSALPLAHRRAGLRDSAHRIESSRSGTACSVLRDSLRVRAGGRCDTPQAEARQLKLLASNQIELVVLARYMQFFRPPSSPLSGGHYQRAPLLSAAFTGAKPTTPPTLAGSS